MLFDSQLGYFRWGCGRGRSPQRRRSAARLDLERLEDRSLLSNYTAGPLIQVSKDPDPLAGLDTGNHPDGNMNFNDEFETRVAVDPTNPKHIVATWVGHDLQANFVGTSFDGGATWQETALPGLTTITGGPYTFAVDPYLRSIAPNGDIYLASVAGSAVPSAILAQKSTDGGLTWTAPITIDQVNDANLFDDKPSTTADPTNPLMAYVVFERDNFTDNTIRTFFSRTTDGGQTWEAAREIADPGLNNFNTGHQILVLPNGTLVCFFSNEVAQTDPTGQVTFTTSLATLRSLDQGQTWLPADGPILGPEIKSIDPTNPDIGATDPNTGVQVNEVTAGIAFAAVDRHNGTLYAVWEDSRFSHGQYNSIAFAESTDGGLTWCDPIQVNQTPDDIPPADRQAFRPSIAVADDGTIGVTYYDFRKNDGGPGTQTDYWFVSSRPEEATNPAHWKHEVRLTDSSFDMQTAPIFFGGEFVGDSNGLATVRNDFVATWSMPEGTDQGNIYFRRLMPRGHDEGGDPGGADIKASMANGLAFDAAAILRALSNTSLTPAIASPNFLPPTQHPDALAAPPSGAGLPSLAAVSASHLPATDAVFAASGPAVTDDDVWLFESFPEGRVGRI